MTPKEKAADIVSAAAAAALNAPGPAVGKVDTDVLREEIEKALKELSDEIERMREKEADAALDHAVEADRWD